AFGQTGELASLCAVVRDKGGLYASHIRNEGAKLLDAVEENLAIGRRSKVRVELSHHKAAGQGNWGKVKDSTALIERARREGLDVTADQYPYTASSTGLAVTIPNWVHEGGTQKMCERLADPAIRARIRGEEVETGRAWDRIVIARARKHPDWAGKSVEQLAREAGRDPLEWTCDALVEHEGAVDVRRSASVPDRDRARHRQRRPRDRARRDHVRAARSLPPPRERPGRRVTRGPGGVSRGPGGRAPRVAILAEGQFARATAKTAIGVLRYAPFEVVAVVDSTRAGTDAAECVGVGRGVPVVADVPTALARGATVLLIGTAAAGGRIPDEYRPAPAAPP